MSQKWCAKFFLGLIVNWWKNCQNTRFLLKRKFEHLLDLFKTSLIEIQYLQIELSDKGSHTNESMMRKIFYL